MVPPFPMQSVKSLYHYDLKTIELITISSQIRLNKVNRYRVFFAILTGIGKLGVFFLKKKFGWGQFNNRDG